MMRQSIVRLGSFCDRALIRPGAAAASAAMSRNMCCAAVTTGNRPTSKFSIMSPRRSFGTAVASASVPENPMFCYQCEQTRNGTGCATGGGGVCGKTPEVAAEQDLLVYILRGISMYVDRTRRILGDEFKSNKELDVFMMKANFSTLTNVNFDATRFQTYIQDALRVRDQAREAYIAAARSKGVEPETLSGPAVYVPSGTSIDALAADGRKYFNVERRIAEDGSVITGLQELISYGLKGLCAYAEHAEVLDEYDPVVGSFIHESLSFLMSEDAKDVDKLLGMALRVGEVNLRVMGLLDKGETTRYGHPVPTKVRTGAVEGKCILVSGHDLRDLENILIQTEGKGINVYTHGELLPAHGYPELKKFPHLVGNFGGPWQLQKTDFAAFPGPIVVTTNCLTEPRGSYSDRIYTRSVVGWKGVKHVTEYDFGAVVAHAQELPGFTKEQPPRELTVGFGHNTILSIADKLIDAVKQGHIKRFFVIGGCDGMEGERSYFTELAKALPQDNVILTMGCGKYRFNKLPLGEIKELGIPRVLDMGQCNDSYGAIQVAVALANAFKCDVNELPLSFAVSWFEQKAVAVFLTLLHLNIKNIRLGPKLPAFVPTPALQVLMHKFDLRPTIDPVADFRKELGF